MPPLPRPVRHGTALSPPPRPIAAARGSSRRCRGPNLAGGESPPPRAGSGFLAQWSGKSALELLDRTRRTMPTDNPAGLSERQYADIVAYLLAANRFRAGATELGGVTVQTVAGRTTEWRYYGGDAGG